MTLIYLVQHGQKHHGPGDPGLTAAGRRQAAAVANLLAPAGLTAVYSSPLRRARETAAPIAAAAGLPVVMDDRLRERMNWGGTTPLAQFLAEWDRTARDRDSVPSTGDSSRRCGQRMVEFVREVSGAGRPAAAVTHGGAIVDLLRTLLGDGAVPPEVWTHGVPPGAVTTMEGVRVREIASVTHLPA
jgi:broad specificity phosphatase PhoE